MEKWIMIDQELTERFIRAKIALQNELAEIGLVQGSVEIESQMMFVETRMEARVKQDVNHAIEELTAFRILLSEIAKPDREE